MAFTQLLLILIWTTACHSQEHKYQVTVGPQTCPGSDPCLTLTEYAQDSSFPRSSVKLILDPGEHKLTEDFVIDNTHDFFIVAADTSSETIVNCGKTAVFTFVNGSRITIEGIAFVSCGENSHAIRMSGIESLNLANVEFSQSTTGSLYIANSPDTVLHNLSVVNNVNSALSIVQFENSKVKLTGTTVIANNSIGGLKLDCDRSFKGVIFQIEKCNITIESLIAQNNTSPDGIVRVNRNELSGSGIWMFDLNQVCWGWFSLLRWCFSAAQWKFDVGK